MGQILALLGWAVGDTGASFATAARIGWMYVGAIHHVAVELDVPDLVVSAPAGSGATSLSVGAALLGLTAIAAWLLFRAGRAVADRRGGRPLARVVWGAAVAPSYAIPMFVLSASIRVRTPFRLGSFAAGELRVSLSPWQALVLPLLIAATAGAAGGLRSALPAARIRPGADRLAAALAGGWRMWWLGAALSVGGLFVAGVVQPDGPAALLTPSTAQYVRAVLDRPAPGLVLFGHHLAAAPNEAVWTLVPAMGGCLGISGGAEADILCYGRFPAEVATAPLPLPGDAVAPVPVGATFDAAPPGYLLFLLVPLAATIAGGRRAARRSGVRGREAPLAGAGAGVVFAALLTATAALSVVTIGYGAAFAEDATAGRIAIGPDLVATAVLALAWGVAGGTIGAVTAARPFRPAGPG
jgi:hypothetical protein